MARRLAAYPEYREDLAGSAGAVPAHWRTCSVKHVATLNPSKSEVRGLGELLATFLPMEAIGDQGELDTSRVRPITEMLSGYTYLREDDVAIAKITPCFENGKGARMRGLTNGLAFATTEVLPLRPSAATNAQYLFYLLSCSPFRQLAEGAMYGAGGQKRVPDAFVAEYKFGLPSLAEQHAIARFLDHETARIDELIAKQQRLIELLKEKRQAVISHAVTKGLNPDAPMKDSGVEWLGDVPVHWNASKVGFECSRVTVGIVVQPARLYAASGVPCLRSLNVSSGEISTEELRFISPESNAKHAKSQLRAGDVVVVRTGRAGVAAIVPDEFDGANCVDLLIIGRSNRVAPRYLLWFLRSDSALAQVGADSVGAIQAHFNTSTLQQMRLPVPPAGEQIEIAAELDAFDKKLQRIVCLAEAQINLLRERRTALISAAVTGKIDVRDWQPPADARDAAEPELLMLMAAEDSADYRPRRA